MNTNLLEKLDTETEQRLILRGITWQDYLTIDSVLEEVPGLRLIYCQGLLEVMTLSPIIPVQPELKLPTKPKFCLYPRLQLTATLKKIYIH